jgi:chitodextrinase
MPQSASVFRGMRRTMALVGLLALTLFSPALASDRALAATTCFGQPASILGTTSGDSLNGTVGDDVIVGQGGNDNITGGLGNDLICAGSGDDGVNGGDGNDRIAGEDGYDLVVGGAGADFFDGGLGTDGLYGGAGADDLHGGSGTDYVRGGADDDTLTGDEDDDALYGDGGINTLDGGNGSDLCLGGTSTACETLTASGPCPRAFAAEFGIRNPSRFTISNTCYSASVTVTRAVVAESDGDRTFNVTDDATGEALHIEFVPRDSGHLALPLVGDHLSLVGSRVVDQHGKLELHPVFQEVYGGITYTSGPQYAGNPESSGTGVPCWDENGGSCGWGGGTGGDTSPPTTPTGLVASNVSANEIDLSWTASSDNVGVAGYDVLRDGVQIGSSTTTSYTDLSVNPATTYQYQVRAVDDSENVSGLSNILTVTTPSLPGIQTLTFIPTGDASIYSDTPSANFGSAAALETDASPIKNSLMKFSVSGVGTGSVVSAKLRVHCVDTSAGSGGEFRRVSDTSWNESTVTWGTAPGADSAIIGSLGPVSAGTSYQVDVSSLVTGDGTVGLRVSSPSTDGVDYSSKEGSFPPELVVTIQTQAVPDTTPPTTPTGLSATAISSSQVNLSWNASSDNVGVGGYEVLRDGAQIATSSTASYSDTSVQPNSSYTYRIVAYDAAGNTSNESDPDSVTTPPAPVTLAPTDDASIRSDSPSSNFGSLSSLETDGKPKRDFLVEFNVSGIGTHSVLAAKLRLYCTNSSNRGGAVSLVSGAAWSEGTVTWNSAPAAGVTPLATLGSVASGTPYEIDLTSVVKADGVISFRVNSSSSNNAVYASKEGIAGQRPQLVLTLGP